MNVAFPAIFLFLLLSPGIVFYFLYQPREVRAADMSPFGTAVLTTLNIEFLVLEEDAPAPGAAQPRPASSDASGDTSPSPR